MSFCKKRQLGVCRIAFMGDVRRKDASMGTQYVFRPHSVCMLNDLMSAEMVPARLFGTIRVIQDHNIKLHLALPKSPQVSSNSVAVSVP
jgi:hypothetical protein